MSSSSAPVFWGGLSGALGVALGAFGAHGLRKSVTDLNLLKTWETAAHYHLIHSGALVLAGLVGPRGAGAPTAARLFSAGIVLFSGSLYLLVLTGIKKLGAITPFGGLALI
eukprot:tig00001525_g9230.t1